MTVWQVINLIPVDSHTPLLFLPIRNLSAKAAVKNQVLEALARVETSSVVQSVVTYAHMWRPLCVSCSRGLLSRLTCAIPLKYSS